MFLLAIICGLIAGVQLSVAKESTKKIASVKIGNSLDSVAYKDDSIILSPSNKWTATSTTNAPSGRDYHTAIWDGTENIMIIWGGYHEVGPTHVYHNDGRKYNPELDSWTTISTTRAPSGRDHHTAIWDGTEMIIWGGWDGTNFLYTGGKYTP